MSRTISWSLVVLAAGTVWRSVPGSPLNLWLGTALIGFGLAIGNVLMPAVIKRDFGERILSSWASTRRCSAVRQRSPPASSCRSPSSNRSRANSSAGGSRCSPPGRSCPPHCCSGCG
ncbi:hypothetical protein [Leucobacter soli]|uniref:hypothetical protein n=1 Tax=Leucobacter soli TaxID=2812850 RepID=UPI00361C3E1B